MIRFPKRTGGGTRPWKRPSWATGAWNTSARSCNAIPIPCVKAEKMLQNFPRTRPKVASEKKGGRKKAGIAITGLVDNFVEVIVHHTAGDPARDGVVWTYLTQQQIADELAKLGTVVSTETVRQLLDEFEMSKRKAQKSVTMGEYEHRNEQFEHIAKLKEEHLASGDPVISMDSKKKERLGNFFREGRLYSTGPLKTFDHDFYSQSGQPVIPHGLYDFGRNVGHITLGTSHDTSRASVH
jgi:hypothetical protein